MIDECSSKFEHNIYAEMNGHMKCAAKSQKTGGRNYVSGSRKSL